MRSISESHTDNLVRASTFKEPGNYTVVLLNDDYTPMMFVVGILKQFFYFSEQKAVDVMLQIHTQGSGMCGVFTYEIAETKVAQVNDYARVNQYPLLCYMEPNINGGS